MGLIHQAAILVPLFHIQFPTQLVFRTKMAAR